jgi:hypothetical protein
MVYALLRIATAIEKLASASNPFEPWHHPDTRKEE